MSYRQISYYTDKPILSKKDICMSYVLKKPMSGHPYLRCILSTCTDFQTFNRGLQVLFLSEMLSLSLVHETVNHTSVNVIIILIILLFK